MIIKKLSQLKRQGDNPVINSTNQLGGAFRFVKVPFVHKKKTSEHA